MLSYESTVWLVFRAIDSLILIALGAWLFRRKLLHMIRSHMEQELYEQSKLKKAVDALAEHEIKLDMQAIEDAHSIERLEQKVRLWQQAVKRKQIRERTEKEDILVRMQALEEQRAHAVRHQTFYATALLQAVDQAEKALEQDNRKTETVEKIVQFMARHKDLA